MSGEHQLPLCISNTMMTPEVVSVILATAYATVYPSAGTLLLIASCTASSGADSSCAPAQAPGPKIGVSCKCLQGLVVGGFADDDHCY